MSDSKHATKAGTASATASAAAQPVKKAADHDWKDGKPPRGVCRVIYNDGTWKDIPAPTPFNKAKETGGFELHQMYSLIGVSCIDIVPCGKFRMVVDDEGFLKGQTNYNAEATRIAKTWTPNPIYGAVLFCDKRFVG